ncbi:ABC transporter substrate-binding protein [Candidatus Leptofilum sp.]|uniref:ABC transporter substrate-binding protein n=1 Tax=Candidatus Leptofilum sp. TaxID=3241576 RepID=UPI003B5B4374
MCNVAGDRLSVISNRFWLLITVYGLLFTGCASVQPVVKIGLVAPFEGAQRELGYDAIYAARLAVQEINEAGGIGGYRVALVALDDRGDEQLAQETAASLAIDPAVVAVIGHGLGETTAVAQPIYAEANLPLLPLGSPPFTTQDPTLLPTEFQTSYNNVTPFDETAGPYAAATYDGMQLLFQAMAAGEADSGTISRDSVTNALTALKYDGLVGTVYRP